MKPVMREAEKPKEKARKASVERTKDIVYIALFAALISVCSWITVPAAVPFTLQTYGIFLAVSLLGGKRGSAAVLCYVLLGLVGLPVFSGFNSGIGALSGPTGGYIVGFVVSALVYWFVTALFGNRTFVKIIAMIAGLIAVYGFGTLWFVYISGRFSAGALLSALSLCVFPFIPFDCAKIILALVSDKILCKAVGISAKQRHSRT